MIFPLSGASAGLRNVDHMLSAYLGIGGGRNKQLTMLSTHDPMKVALPPCMTLRMSVSNIPGLTP